jgi:hypothetical protein
MNFINNQIFSLSYNMMNEKTRRTVQRYDLNNYICREWFIILRDNYKNNDYKHYVQTLDFIQDNNIFIDANTLLLITNSFIDNNGKLFRNLIIHANLNDMLYKSSLLNYKESLDENIYILQKELRNMSINKFLKI